MSDCSDLHCSLKRLRQDVAEAVLCLARLPASQPARDQPSAIAASSQLQNFAFQLSIAALKAQRALDKLEDAVPAHSHAKHHESGQIQQTLHQELDKLQQTVALAVPTATAAVLTAYSGDSSAISDVQNVLHKLADSAAKARRLLAHLSAPAVDCVPAAASTRPAEQPIKCEGLPTSTVVVEPFDARIAVDTSEVFLQHNQHHQQTKAQREVTAAAAVTSHPSGAAVPHRSCIKPSLYNFGLVALKTVQSTLKPKPCPPCWERRSPAQSSLLEVTPHVLCVP